jgi:hypothetical protein
MAISLSERESVVMDIAEPLALESIETEFERAAVAPWQTIIFPKRSELQMRSEWIERSNGMSAASVMAHCLAEKSLEFIFATAREAVFLLGGEASAVVADNPSWYFDYTASLGGFAVKGSTAIH